MSQDKDKNMAADTVETPVKCQFCGDDFKNDHGLKIHVGRAHKDVDAGTDAPKPRKKVTVPKSKVNGDNIITKAAVSGTKVTMTVDGKRQTLNLASPRLLVDLSKDIEKSIEDVLATL